MGIWHCCLLKAKEMKVFFACLLVVACVGELATSMSALVEDYEDANTDNSNLVLLQTQEANRLRCRSRRGIGETKSVGKDCIEKTEGDLIKVEFPMKQVKVEFPCIEPFSSIPLVMANLLGPDKNKLYATSLRNVTNTYFSVNIQRVDDIENPDMKCDEIFLNYLAVIIQ